MSSSIIPEIVGQTEILEESPMTPQELQRKVELETIFKSADCTKNEQRLIQGKALIHICREKLYRGNNGGRSWEDYLKQDSKNLTSNSEPIKSSTANNLRAFYMLRTEIFPKTRTFKFFPSVSHAQELMGYLPLPSKNPDKYDEEDFEKIKKTINIWKTACGKAGTNKIPSFTTVRELAYEQRAKDNKTKPRINTTQEIVKTPKQIYDPSIESANRFVTPSLENDSPPIKTWEQERNTQEVDPYSE